MFQSTHPRGVRLTLPPWMLLVWCFNPRTREGCDSVSGMYNTIYDMFQSTHPRGVRRTKQSEQHPCRSFNPRTREGCDSMVLKHVELLLTFQSTHPRGVRPHIQKCIEYQYAKLCFLRHNAKLLKTRHIRHRRKRQPTDFQRLR